LECLSKSFRHALLDIHVMHQITTKMGLKMSSLQTKHIFLVFSGKITKNTYKIIGSFFCQFFDCEIIANKRGLIEPLNKKLIRWATLSGSSPARRRWSQEFCVFSNNTLRGTPWTRWISVCFPPWAFHSGVNKTHGTYCIWNMDYSAHVL
jgi:hypothetical protein